MEWWSVVSEHPLYRFADTVGIFMIARWAFLEFVKEKRHIALHQKNSAKIDWLIRQTAATAHAQGVALEDGLPEGDRAKLDALFHPEKQPCPTNTTSPSSSRPCSH